MYRSTCPSWWIVSTPASAAESAKRGARGWSATAADPDGRTLTSVFTGTQSPALSCTLSGVCDNTAEEVPSPFA
ncbi:hypothetical protein [Clavibacter tessellarius]|uniref:hypothetical protein n=1 Tax=Clavibacter tessellarius TaxID=31965 RepID=UPI003252AAA9